MTASASTSTSSPSPLRPVPSAPSTPSSTWSPRWLLASPWLVVVFCWPATLLAWYYITLVTDPSGLRGDFLLKYLVALLCLDSAICVYVVRRITRHARAVLGLCAGQGAELPLARLAWVEALNLPLRTAQLILALIAITALPGALFFAARGEWDVVGYGLAGAAMAGACELTVLFPLVQGSTLPLLRSLKGAHPELRLRDQGVRAPPLRAYFAFGLASLTTVSIVMVATLMHAATETQGSVGHMHPTPAFGEWVGTSLFVLCLGSMAVGMALQLAFSVLGPMRRLAETMRRFSEDGSSVRAGLLQLGEVGALCEGFDDMAGNLERSRATIDEREALLRHSQRFEVMASVTAGFAHEVANPLSCVAANLDATQGEVTEVLESATALDTKTKATLQACAAALADAGQAAEQMTYLLRDMRSFSRREIGEPVSCDITALVDGAIRIASGEIRRRGVVQREYQPVPAVRGSPQRLSQVFLNLLTNAARALPERGGGEVTVSIRSVGGEVVVQVRDNGHGIAPAHRARIFEALFSAWPAGGGTGLGLHVSRDILQAHGGSIAFEDAPSGGASFTVRLPAEGANAGAQLVRA